jgi:phage terminase Nu1 subunit (DNA packaging protein)
MRAEEIEYIETEVKVNLIPEIKKSIPTVLGWVIRLVFPKLERKIIDFITDLFEKLLSKRE